MWGGIDILKQKCSSVSLSSFWTHSSKDTLRLPDKLIEKPEPCATLQFHKKRIFDVAQTKANAELIWELGLSVTANAISWLLLHGASLLRIWFKESRLCVPSQHKGIKWHNSHCEAFWAEQGWLRVCGSRGWGKRSFVCVWGLSSPAATNKEHLGFLIIMLPLMWAEEGGLGSRASAVTQWN